jgi:hypothetical protein
MTTTDSAYIIRFVKETLGCQCPDDVFKQIEFSRQHEDSLLDAKIIVGGRLLIYIVNIDSDSSPNTVLEKLLHEGKKEREASGLNRFRLVIATDDPKSIEKDMTSNFESLRGSDDRIHLHVIAKSDPTLVFLLQK